MDRALAVILGFVGAGVVLLLGVALVLTLRTDEPFEVVFTPLDTDFPAVEHDPDAASELIDAWAAWRNGTFVTIGSWTRTLDGRSDPLVGEVYLAQAPPRRLVIRLGALVADIDDADRFENVVVAELGLVGGYVTGPERLYDVTTTAAGCYQAELIQPALASPWGRWAEYCFDDETGALLSARVRRQSAIDVERNVVVATEVTDDDFIADDRVDDEPSS
jgi:hypothetical protein